MYDIASMLAPRVHVKNEPHYVYKGTEHDAAFSELEADISKRLQCRMERGFLTDAFM